MKQTKKLFILGATLLLSSVASADTVTQLKGKAYISYTSQVQPVLLNQKLRPGQTITTGENSQVTIQLNKNCRIVVPPLHYVRIKDDKSCPAALQIKGTTAVAKGSTPAGTGAAAKTGTAVAATKGFSAIPLLLAGGAAVALIVHDNRKSSPD